MAEEDNNNEEAVIEPETPETPKGAAVQAEALIRLKKKSDKDLLNIRELKGSIEPLVQQTPISTPSGTVSFVTGSVTKMLNKNLIRQVLIDTLKISPESADKIIATGSVEKVIESYVKVTPK